MTVERASLILTLRRAHAFGGGDVYGAGGVASIIDVPGRDEAIRRQCEEIGPLLSRLPEFASACGYEWCGHAEAYDLPSEAAFQRRALFMLAKYWIETDERTSLPPRLGGVVAVQEFITRFGLCSPRIRSLSGQRLLLIPAGFVELATWLFAGLRCWSAAERPDAVSGDGWDLVTAAVSRREPKAWRHVCGFELIARTLAEQGRDRRLLGENAALLIREGVPALAGESGDLDEAALFDFEQNATYMVAEFAIAHELAHLLCGHDLEGPAHEPDREREADETACLLLEMTASLRTFGWGEDILGAKTQATLGLALFDCLLTTRTALLDNLLSRRGHGGRRDQEEERSRKAAARAMLKLRLVDLEKRGSHEDALRIAALATNCDALVQDLSAAMAAISDADVEQAVAIARRTAVGALIG